MKPRAVIFDLFHTLIGVKNDRIEGPSTAAILGIPQERWNTLIFEQSEDRLCGRLTEPEQIIGQLVEIAGIKVSPEKIAQAARTRGQRFETSLAAVQTHVLETLDRVRESGVLTALCSNADRLERKGWDNSPLAGRFDATVFSCDVGCMKPQPKIYQLCLDRLDMAADQTLFVGDGSCNELAGAKAVGMTTVMTTEIISDLWPEVIAQRKKDADHIITTIEQVLDYL
jgi:putative hydrolase of the HAD superfamily